MPHRARLTYLASLSSSRRRFSGTNLFVNRTSQRPRRKSRSLRPRPLPRVPLTTLRSLRRRMLVSTDTRMLVLSSSRRKMPLRTQPRSSLTLSSRTHKVSTFINTSSWCAPGAHRSTLGSPSLSLLFLSSFCRTTRRRFGDLYGNLHHLSIFLWGNIKHTTHFYSQALPILCPRNHVRRLDFLVPCVLCGNLHLGTS
jgi:hypothetical protein